MLKRFVIAVAATGSFVLVVAIAVYGLGRGWYGTFEQPGVPQDRRIPPEVVKLRSTARAQAAAAIAPGRQKQILFGDFHVHTTFSSDAFMDSLPYLTGEGTHPPADACDFARYCSALDFWSLNDHAENLTPRQWQESVAAIRQCNAVAGDAENPDVVAFLGWEWTQASRNPATHYGHKNVVLASTDEAQIPTRPIGTGRPIDTFAFTDRIRMSLGGRQQRYLDFATYIQAIEDVPLCAEGVASPQLPGDCREIATDPATLFRKLNEWGFDSLVIPHGNAWGIYTPPEATWHKQLAAGQHDPQRQTLIELYSGHGNSEEYREYGRNALDAAESGACPAPTAGFLPGCWRAGELIRERCLESGAEAAECESRAVDARSNFRQAGRFGTETVPDTQARDWGDAGQCRDCFLPAYSHRPNTSVQAALATTEFGDNGEQNRFRFGFIGSSDNHRGRGGTGYKEFARFSMTELVPRDPATILAGRNFKFKKAPKEGPEARAFSIPVSALSISGYYADFERFSSYLYTGGLIAVHAAARDRDSIWQAVRQREVYATSGERILLWFDLADGEDGQIHPMGSELESGANPSFEVRALGAFKQKPGCPDYATSSLSAARLDQLCKGECYNPGNDRKAIARIEVVKIRPQANRQESIGELIEDPWRVLPCETGGEGCSVTFSDPDFAADGRDAVYYVRAIQEPSLAVNGAQLHCEYDGQGRCINMQACSPDRSADDACLGEAEERAWSSPIFLNWKTR